MSREGEGNRGNKGTNVGPSGSQNKTTKDKMENISRNVKLPTYLRRLKFVKSSF